MRLNKEAYKYLQSKLRLYIAINSALLLLVYLLFHAEGQWVNKRSEAVIIPEFKYTYPIIPYMPVTNKEMNDAKLYTFIERYIKLFYDERMIDFHKPTNLSRKSRAFLKRSLLKVSEMSKGLAKKEVLEKYANSKEIFRTLEQCNCGWVFNIHAIESIQKTNQHDAIYVSVLGEFQLTHDAANTKLPHRLWGYKRIWLTIIQSRPSFRSNKEPANEYGLYVTNQYVEDINYSDRDRLMRSIFTKGYLVP